MVEPRSSFTVFIVKDLDAAKSFYTENLGFDVVFSGDWYIHLAAQSGVQLGFMLPDQPTQPPLFHEQYSGKGVIFSIEVEDVDKAFEEARSKSLNIVFELKSEDWGQRHFCVQDPNGIYVDIVQPFEPSEEYQGDYVSE